MFKHFRTNLNLQKHFKDSTEFPYTPRPVSSVVNILHCNGTFITTQKPELTVILLLTKLYNSSEFYVFLQSPSVSRSPSGHITFSHPVISDQEQVLKLLLHLGSSPYEDLTPPQIQQEPGLTWQRKQYRLLLKRLKLDIHYS